MASAEASGQAAVKAQPPAPSPYVRVDTLAIKQQLHDLLGSRGLPYWEALREFLTGKLGRQELEDLVMSLAGVVDRQFVPLHNHFLMAIVSNAHNSSTTPAPGPGQSKRSRPDDTTPYGAKRRVLSWVLGTSRREREKLKLRDAHEENADKLMKDVERRRDERRKTGGGWVGGSELTRERAVLGPSSSVGANADDDSKPNSPAPTPISSLPAPLATAAETRFLPSADDLRNRVARASTDSGLEGAAPGVGQFLNAALEDHLKNLITSHIHLHRSGHLNVSSSSSSQPALSYTASAPASPTSTASTLPPQTPPATFSQSAFENLLTIAPANVLQQGRVARLVGDGIMDEEGFQQLWIEAAAERRKVTGIDEKWSSASRSVPREDEGEEPEEDGRAKGKNKSHVYEYVDPASILDTLS